MTYSVFDNVYYKDGEFVSLCPTCFESEAKLIHLQEIPPSVNSHYFLSNLKCHNCSSYMKYKKEVPDRVILPFQPPAKPKAFSRLAATAPSS